ncbi:unnamed protein product [Lactuca saligna]|uniref:Replication protein A 70 kDa DNA-binding subunit B/D first OB fold domain-containing protein n=1 Tax=Lactuca saligna TaxID=75948 RepID=A0AA36A1H1_LACSI|nr:unnamed protein product [Lactuca saligna]
MVTPNVTFIADVDVLRDDLTLKVCVINLWKHMSFYNKDEIWSIELILLDEQGSKIQATVWKKFLYRFKNILKDGSTFYITSPSFASQKSGCFKITPQDQKLTFVQNTVLKCDCRELGEKSFLKLRFDRRNSQMRRQPRVKHWGILLLLVQCCGRLC